MPLIIDLVTTHELRLLAAGLLDPAREVEILARERIDSNARAQIAAICLGAESGESELQPLLTPRAGRRKR